uniref:Transmembrane channel-like protein n=1 Tax=Cyprinus carpio TaxID=7962 RepID=A0A8C1ZQ92_CYPCA
MLVFVHAAESCSSDLSSDSCEYYQTEIFGQLPSSQAHRRLHAETIADDQSLLDRVSWNPSVPLRNLPVCLQDKRDIRDRQHLQRCSIGYWDSWRQSQQKTRRRLKEHVGGAVSGLLPWRHTLHKIEGQFGVGVKAYFVFLRYLLCLNLLYCVIIIGSVLTPTLVSRAQDSSTHRSQGFQNFSFKDIFFGSVSNFIMYLPPITMTTVNYILPHVFSKISEFEDYSLTIQLNLTLIRSIFLKLSSLAIYLVFFIMATEENKCRENEFGKEMYKLTIFNLLECFFNAFCVAYPRVLLVESFPSSKLVQLLGKKQFEITFNVLDLVYIQTVILVGVFYCPLLPAINTVRLLLLFYVKKFTVVRCCVPPQRMFRTASSSVLFHFMLLLGLFMSLKVIFSKLSTCGPFEGNRTLFKVTSVCINTLPIPVQTTIGYMSSEAFAFALILAEVVILTSYVSRGRANRKAIERLKDMLVMVISLIAK